MSKLHVILMLADGGIVCTSQDIAVDGSVSQALHAVPLRDDVKPHLDNVVRAIRVWDGNVFVDDRPYFLWVTGLVANRPVENGMKHARIPKVRIPSAA